MTRRRTVEVQLPDASLEALSSYREKMLELIGVELSEGQVAAMLIHFGKQVGVERPEGTPASFALPATTEVLDAEPPRSRRPSGGRRRGAKIAKGATARVRRSEKRGGASSAGKCACGCGTSLATPGAKWARGHHKRGARAAARRVASRRDKESDPEAEVVWDGRGPLSRPWERRETEDLF